VIIGFATCWFSKVITQGPVVAGAKTEVEAVKLHKEALWALGLIFAALAVGLMPIPGPYPTILMSAAMNVGHVLVFGALALSILFVIRRYWPALGHRVGLAYFTAASVTAVLTVLTELAQVFGPRDADLGDVGRGLLGIVSFLLIYAGFDRRATIVWRKAPAGTRVCVITIACLAATVGVTPLARSLWAYYARASAFPVLLDFESSTQAVFLITNDADLTVVESPAAWSDNRTSEVGHLLFRQAEYPGLIIQEPYPDWSERSSLLLSVFLPGSVPQTLNLRIHDAAHDWTYADRFNWPMKITPGSNLIRIPLSVVRGAPESREMDMRQISGIVIFSHRPGGPFDVYLDNLRLE
jgi:hypothetical protein